MKKILTVVGARPQFIKAAPLSLKLREAFTEILVHTGQHYDDAMSDQFFRELGIPTPDYNLEVGSGSHGEQTAKMLVGLEHLMMSEKPDAVLVFGDTNSTVAGALAAAKIHIPVFHVEAGLRSFNRAMPEEHNRVLTDHMSDLLFCPTETAVRNLANEGIVAGVSMVGDVMADSVRSISERAEQVTVEELYAIIAKNIVNSSQTKSLSKFDDFYLSTIHRAENTDSLERLNHVFGLLGQSGKLVILPVHPRLDARIVDMEIPANIVLIRPQGYMNMMALIRHSSGVITDSGGLQKEAYLMRRKCTTLRTETEWIETLSEGWNTLCDPMNIKIEEFQMNLSRTPGVHFDLYGDGMASERICTEIYNWFEK